MSDPSPTSSYNIGGPYGQAPPQSRRKRSRPDDHSLQESHFLEHPPYGQAQGPPLPVPQGYSQQAYQPAQSVPPIHHHHGLPQSDNKRPRMEDAPSSPVHHGPPSVVGQEGMPPPAQRPRGPKLKFTPEDDSLLVDLKEKKNLTWKQIADFFPGRSSGTLQVRYCTKLKAKTTNWTDEMVQKLRNAMQEYENDRWRIVSSKLGQGFSAAACRDKAQELELEERAEEEEQSGYTQSQLAPPPTDPGASFQ